MSKNLDICLLLACYGGLLPEKQRYFTECYYCDDLSLAEIAENEGITKQGVRDAVKRAEIKLLEIEETIGIVKKSAKLKELADNCRICNNEQNFLSLMEAIDNL